MLGDLKALYDLVDKTLRKRRDNQEEANRDKVLVAIYKLGDGGRKGVIADTLETESGFTKAEVFQAVAAAEERGWLIDMSSHDGRAWGLTPQARYYVQSLLEP